MKTRFNIQRNKSEYQVTLHQHRVNVKPNNSRLNQTPTTYLLAFSHQLVAQYYLNKTKENEYVGLIQHFDARGWSIRNNSED